MSKKSYKDIQENVIEVALRLSAKVGWSNLSIADIAYEMDMSRSEMNLYFYDKDDILYALGKFIDRKVMEAELDVDAPVRDKIFEILMERFDVINEYRDGIKSIISSFKCSPKSLIFSFPHIGKSMAMMLEACGENVDGVQGAIKVAGLSGIYLNCIRVWLDDETSDMSKTMACLDKSLGRAEMLVNKIGL